MPEESFPELNRNAIYEALRNAERARVRRHQPKRFRSVESARIRADKNPGPSELSWRRDLNPRPSDYKSDALPTELRQHWQTG